MKFHGREKNVIVILGGGSKNLSEKVLNNYHFPVGSIIALHTTTCCTNDVYKLFVSTMDKYFRWDMEHDQYYGYWPRIKSILSSICPKYYKDSDIDRLTEGMEKHQKCKEVLQLISTQIFKPNNKFIWDISLNIYNFDYKFIEDISKIAEENKRLIIVLHASYPVENLVEKLKIGEISGLQALNSLIDKKDIIIADFNYSSKIINKMKEDYGVNTCKYLEEQYL